MSEVQVWTLMRAWEWPRALYSEGQASIRLSTPSCFSPGLNMVEDPSGSGVCCRVLHVPAFSYLLFQATFQSTGQCDLPEHCSPCQGLCWAMDSRWVHSCISILVSSCSLQSCYLQVHQQWLQKPPGKLGKNQNKTKNKTLEDNTMALGHFCFRFQLGRSFVQNEYSPFHSSKGRAQRSEIERPGMQQSPHWGVWEFA